MAYHLLDVSDRSCAEIGRQFNRLLIGRIALSTSYHSGKLFRPGWKRVNGFCVTPPITRPVVDRWPVARHDCFDEWWVFDHLVPENFGVTAFCNFGMAIGQYKEGDFENRCRLDHYWERYRPVGVLGNNQRSAYLNRVGTDEGPAKFRLT